MIDIDKQIAHWMKGADEEWQVAQDLVGLKRNRHSLFFAHLSLEKLLKAHVCRTTKNLAPRTHSLLRLADQTDLELSNDQKGFLARFDRYQIEGRYPDALPPEPTETTTLGDLKTAGEMLKWLKNQF